MSEGMNRLMVRQNRVWWLVVLLIVGLSWPTGLNGVQAQETTPTSSPTAPNIAVIVGAGGATLWSADGSPLVNAPASERLTATARSGDGRWLLVQTGAGDTGWVVTADVLVFNIASLPAQTVSITPATPTPHPTVTPTATAEPTTAAADRAGAAAAAQPQPTPALAADGQPVAQVVQGVSVLNLRAGPGTGYAVIGKATPGERFAAHGRTQSGGWVQIAIADGTGWVAAQYVAVSQGVTSLPVIETANEVMAAAAAPADNPPVAASTSPTGLSGKLVIQTVWGGAIYVYDLERGTLHYLTNGFDPALSPDGSQVAFTRQGGEHGLYLINVDGSNERNIFSERVGFFAPKWSPDGRWIAFTRTDRIEECFDAYEGFGFPQCVAGLNPYFRSFPRIEEIRARISRVDTDGGNYRDIPTLEHARAIDWSSAGIVYASPGGLQVTQDSTADTNRLVYFDVYQQYYQDPDWQPGGGRIVFHHRRPGHWDIYAVNPDGGGFTALTRPPTALVDTMPSNVAPAWSPDGQHIVFLSNRTPQKDAGPWRVWVMNADGSNQRQLPIDLPIEYGYVEEQMLDWGP